MSINTALWTRLAAFGTLAVLGACAQAPAPNMAMPEVPVASNPPPVAPGPDAVWHRVVFNSGSYVISGAGKQVVAEVATYLQAHPNATSTIIGRTDTVGSKDYNMRLSHRRADAVRDALVYGDKVPAAQVETRWTGETRSGAPMGDEAAVAANRVVDIAIH